MVALRSPCLDGHESCDLVPSLDATGDPRLGCRAYAGLCTARHDSMSRELFAFARRAEPRSVIVERERERESNEPPGQRRLRPGDVVLDCGNGCVFYDLTVVNPFFIARLCAARNAGTPAFAAK